MPKPPRLELTIRRTDPRWKLKLPDYRKQVRLWCNAAITAPRGGALAVVLANDSFIQELNHTYRGKNKPTNVLSFPGNDGEIGDIILAYETLAREAGEQQKSLAQHTAHLVIHGCLHLLGFDHETLQEAREMEAREIAILSTLGIANPYETNGYD